jgi:hypothetical protein
MKATLVFQSHESVDISVGMVFIPCICWVIGSKIISNPHRSNPMYLKGDFQNLLQLPEIFKYINKDDNKSIILIVHSEGHGTFEDIEMLIEDIISYNYHLQIIRNIDNMTSLSNILPKNIKKEVNY